MSDTCVTNLCENNAVCVEINKQAHCICKHGWLGKFCEKPVQLCDVITCSSGGICVESRDHQPVCNCLLGWQGVYCEKVGRFHFIVCFA